MPRPASSAWRRASAAASSPAAAPCTCSCRPRPAPAPAHAPPHAAHYSTTAPTAAAPAPAARAGPPPVLEFLAPGFGFFSRALPPLVSPSARAPPPPSPASPRATAPQPAPQALRHPFAAPPPPPPQPQHHAFDVRARAWRPLYSAPPGLRRSAIPLPSAGKSTSAAGAAAARVEERSRSDEEQTGAKGKEVERAPAGEGEEGRRERGALRDEASAPEAPPSEAPPTPSARLSTLLATHAPSSLPHIRGTDLIRARAPSRARRKSSFNRTPAQPLSLAEAQASISALAVAARDDEFYLALSPQEQLDFVRAFSAVARAVPAPPPPDPLAPPAAIADARRALRLRASKKMLALLRRSRAALTAFASLGTSPYSSLRQSAALLFLDAVTLAEGVGAVGQVLLGGEGDGSAEQRELASALETLFRPPQGGFLGREDAADAESAPQPPPEAEGEEAKPRTHARDEATRTENQRTAFAQLLQLWHAAPSRSASAEQALALVTAFSSPALDRTFFDAHVSGSNASVRAQEGFNLVLRRSYGSLLAALEPTPAAWLAERAQGADAVAQIGRTADHLVNFLAMSGHPVPALEVHRTLEGVRTEAGLPLFEGETEHAPERVETLTALVLGLARDKLFDDAAPLATQLERLAAALQADLDAALAAVPLDNADAVLPAAQARERVLVAEAYRVLGKLAAEQGRSAALEHVLGRLARLGIKASTSLEPAARRMRVQLVRRELDAARAVFAAAGVSHASDADRARLWAQLVVAHVRVNDVEGAIRTLQELVAAGLYAPLSAINPILHGFARRGDSKSAFDLFAQLDEGAFPRLKPDATSWNALVLAHATARDPTAAEATIANMKHRGLVPTRHTWTTLMSAYVENGAWAAAFAVYRFLDANPDPALRPDTHVANVMLKACIITGTPGPTVLELFRSLVARGVRPDMVTYTLVLQSLCAAGLMDVAEDLYQIIDGADRTHGGALASRGTVKPDILVFSALIAGYARRGDGPKARACLAEMRARGIEPSSVTVAIIVSARLMAHDTVLSGKYLAHALERATAQARLFLDGVAADQAKGAPGVVKQQRADALERRLERVRRPAHLDRPLATGNEAIAVFGPILRTLARTGDAAAALKLFEEILDRREAVGPDGDTPIALYTILMSSFRQKEAVLSQLQAEAAARNVHLVWMRLYESVSRRFVRLQPVDGPAHPATGAQPRRRMVDPAQAALLCLPLTILVEAASRAGMHMLIEPTWRRLAREGFAFDASNWNALALYFVRDMQLERALWITEHVLCEPTPLDGRARAGQDEAVPAFERELASIRRADAVGRSPARLYTARLATQDHAAKRSMPSLQAQLQRLSTGKRTGAEGGAPPPLDLGDALIRAHSARSAALWHPYGRTLAELQAALDSLSVEGSLRASRKYANLLSNAPQHVSQAQAQDQTSAREEVSRLTPEQAADAREDLQRRHPKTMRAIELWRTRRERLAAERNAYEERMQKGF
ncbi:hypothetical protein JCM10450v2_000878 [Rhodotorula kratochvilovae]